MIAPPGLSLDLSPTARRQLVRWAAVCILLFAAGVRFAALNRDARFHPDEALFANFARHAAVQGDWLLGGNLDKPPLAIYASALGMTFFGIQPLANGVLDLNIYTGEFTARLPSTLAGVVWAAVMMALAKRLYHRNSLALWAGLLAACSPLAILFSASAFTDGWLLLWMGAALWASAGRHWVWSGVCLALAFATKQQGLVYLPLAAGVGWALHGWSWRLAAGLAVPLGAGVTLFAAWDGLRTGSPSVFELAAANNAPKGLVPAGALAERAGQWLNTGRGLFGSATTLFALLITAFTLRSLFRRPVTQRMRADFVLAAFVLVYLLAHLLIAFNLYDRYWLPLLPPLILLALRAGSWAYALLSRLIMRAEIQIAAIVMGLVLLAAGLDAAAGNSGAAGGLDDSFAQQPAVDDAAAWLTAQHVGAIVYDRWLGWQLGYYLGAWSDKRLTYFPDPVALAEAALVLDEREPRFFPVPSAVDAGAWLESLTADGFKVEKAAEVRGITIYQLTPPE
ncbi:MAG: glycosyltransferase family 39 protein [Anaerolineae bacterium]|nr:glycosyltransferase family 39 protein [Anaerolineae bacterium]